MKYLLPFFLLLLALPSQAQKLRRLVTFFDSTKVYKREVYTALVAADTVPQGTYKRFYRSGKLEQQTSFTQGKRDSAYVEFHPTGTRRLEATYRDGIRQGPFKTYYDDGHVAQTGFFENDEPTGELIYYHPNGEVRLRTTLAKGQPNGPLKALYPDGKTQAEIGYVDGQPNGAVKFYYPNGVVQSEGSFTRGLLSGPYKTYYPNSQIEVEVLADKNGRGRYRSYYPSGKLQTESTYAAAPLVQRPVKNQLGDDLTKRVAPPTGTANLDGPATSYFESGQIKTKITYRNGVPNGHGLEYFENGNLREDTDYSNNGRDRKITRYHDVAGQLAQAEEQYKNNRPAGTWREFYPDGKTPRKTETYGPSGRLVGERLTYFENGQVQSRQPYLNGFMAGIGQEYFPSGKVRKETTYVRSMLQGPFRELREDGTLAVNGLYRNSKQSGVWTYYKEDGQTVDRTVTYRNGTPVQVNTKPKAKPAVKRK
ncbi:toxin-antitoxin system YwqK family antitoxin [Hymenobacter terrenus]|uniref:toxin-antitoxin system YwqK family antitoxin n=1 Tax=Hymenobacter terrenus TaxID=1629124 RepID=UPI000619B534|nr:toxin-antitoxin system YwqK family antitoxin [Hymenobacter terrenus]